LFQLYNGTSTLDIGQTPSHAVDMTTWSAFCGGIASHCVYGKFYGQINGNVLVPSTVAAPSGPNCSGGTNYICATPFVIEAATGLPIVQTTAPQEYYNGSLGADDTVAKGIDAHGSSISIAFNGINTQSTFCCGMFGVTHKYNAGDVTGTDFSIFLGYGPDTGNDKGICGTATTFCLGIDEESGAGNEGDYGSSIINLAAFVTFDSASKIVTGTVNGIEIFSTPIAAAIPNPGAFIHFGGGGDLSQPAPSIMREGLITNSAMTAAQINAIYRNMTGFYRSLSFPQR
jgi:hypothetical protein